MSELLIIAVGFGSATLGLVIGSNPSISEGVRKRHVRDNPRMFPEQNKEEMNDE